MKKNPGDVTKNRAKKIELDFFSPSPIVGKMRAKLPRTTARMNSGAEGNLAKKRTINREANARRKLRAQAAAAAAAAAAVEHAPDPDGGASDSDAATVDSESEDDTTLEEAAVVTDAPVTAAHSHSVTFMLIVDSVKADSERGPCADCETNGAAPNEPGLVEQATEAVNFKLNPA